MSTPKKPLSLIDDVSLAFRMYQNATDEFDEIVAAHLGLNRTDLRCLDIIDRAERVTAGDLARETGLTTGAVTSILDRLEHVGYVCRVRDTVDRRCVFVELTEKARQGGAEIWGPMAARSRAQLGRYSQKDLKFIRDFLHGSREFMMQEISRLRAWRGKGKRKRSSAGSR